MNKWINKWIKVNEIPEHVKRIPSRNSSANYEAIFRKFLQKNFKYWRKQIVIVLFSLQNGKISTNIAVKGTLNVFSNEKQMKKNERFGSTVTIKYYIISLCCLHECKLQFKI